MSLKYMVKRITDGILSFFYYNEPAEDNDYPESQISDYQEGDFSQVLNEISELNSNYINLQKKYAYLAEYMTDVDKINAKLSRGEYVRTQQLKDVLAATFNDNQEKYSGVRDDIKELNKRIDELEEENSELRERIKTLARYITGSMEDNSVQFQPAEVTIETAEEIIQTNHKPRLIKKSSIEQVDGEEFYIK